MVADKAWYQVKFENWKKLSWEPEENLTGCQDVIDNFMLEEKVVLFIDLSILFFYLSNHIHIYLCFCLFISNKSSLFS